MKNVGGGAGGSIHTKFEVAVGDEHENELDRAFGAQNRKPSGSGSVLVWAVQIAMALV